LSFSSDERTSRRQFCGAGQEEVGKARVKMLWEEEARLGAEVALREEEEDHRRVSDVLVERPDVLEIIYLCAHRGASEGLCV